MPIRKILTPIALLVASAIGGAAYQKIEKVPPTPVSPADGKAMFVEYCAVCHGTSGQGNGPAASALKKAPADLTQLTRRSKDGKFPALRVSQYISGADAVDAHGTRDMPIWGDVLRNLTGVNRDAVMVQRISNLTDYVKTLQVR